MNMKRGIFSLLLLAAVVGCSPGHDPAGLKFSGTLEMLEHSLGAPVAGRIQAVLVEEGQTVKAGQAVAYLDHYEQARRDFERSKDLSASGAVSTADYEHDRQAMQDQQIVSPVDGVVLLKVHENGEVVTAGSPVVIVGDPMKLWVKVYIPEDVISRVTMHQRMKIRVDGLDEDLTGTVTFIATAAEFTPRNIQTPEERATQTFAVKVTLDHPPLALHPGVGADVFFDQETSR